ncbi:MAG: N-acetyltransferase [Acidobacteria bacterium]|nr:MAG: N-acetyltransferase [Acidobacteriota bacterium]
MKSVSPPESKHALDLEGLRKPDITFWTVWENHQLVGCGAIKELDATHGEIKSMRTSASHRRKGVATRSHGFQDCAPFADYREDPNSVFLTRDLSREP